MDRTDGSEDQVSAPCGCSGFLTGCLAPLLTETLTRVAGRRLLKSEQNFTQNVM
jgi:hypothetical protein